MTHDDAAKINNYYFSRKNTSMTHDDAAKINNYYFSGKNTSMGKKFHMAKKAKQNYIYGFSR